MERLGRFQLVRKLASGGMGEVFLARSEGAAGFHKQVVLKRIHAHLAEIPEFVEMFLNEARLAAQLNHPNIVQLFDLGEEQGHYYSTMELVDGPSFFDLIHAARDRQMRLPVPMVLKVVMLMCEALDYAHTFVDENGQPLNLIHRDATPENILISRAGAVKLADFGVARATSLPRVTQIGAFKGKMHYLAPEQLGRADIDKRVDVFSLGVVLFEALTGTKPFDGDSPNQILGALLYQAPPALLSLRPDAPPALGPIVARALAKDPSQRYPTAGALRADLEGVLVSLGTPIGAVDIVGVAAQLCPPEPIPAEGTAPTQASIRIAGRPSVPEMARVSTPAAPVTERSEPSRPRLGRLSSGASAPPPATSVGQDATLLSGAHGIKAYDGPLTPVARPHAENDQTDENLESQLKGLKAGQDAEVVTRRSGSAFSEGVPAAPSGRPDLAATIRGPALRLSEPGVGKEKSPASRRSSRAGMFSRSGGESSTSSSEALPQSPFEVGEAPAVHQELVATEPLAPPPVVAREAAPPEPSEAELEAKPRSAMLPLFLVLGVGLLGVLGWLYQQGQLAPVETPSVTENQVEWAYTDGNLVEVDSTPPGAEMVVEGHSWGKTPLKMLNTQGTDPKQGMKYVLTLDGYPTYHGILIARRGLKLKVTFVKAH